jgi:hypothetical protein
VIEITLRSLIDRATPESDLSVGKGPALSNDDVSPFEWQRYEELCGPVDAEVSVPELVLEGDLCPHQDYA